jgi:hypothetical protein
MASAVTEGCTAERRKKRGRKRRQSDLPSGSSGPLMQVSENGLKPQEILVCFGPSGRSVPSANLSCLGNYERKR